MPGIKEGKDVVKKDKKDYSTVLNACAIPRKLFCVHGWNSSFFYLPSILVTSANHLKKSFRRPRDQKKPRLWGRECPSPQIGF